MTRSAVTRIAVGLLLMLGLSAACAQGGAPVFPRGIYWAWEFTAPMAKQRHLEMWDYVDKQAQELSQQYHMNYVWTVNIGTKDLIKLAGICAKYGIQVAGTPEPVIWYRTDRSPAGVEKTARDSVNLLKDAKGLAAYVLIDEPTLWEIDHMENLRAAFRRLDPTRDVIVVTMVGMTDATRVRTHFPVLTTDCYPFFAAKDPNGPNTPEISRAYYRNTLDTLAASLAREGRSLWAMPQCFEETWGPWYWGADMHLHAQPGAYLHWRQPTVGEARWQVWSALASGAKGIIFFLLHPPVSDELLKPSKAAAAPEGLPRVAQETNTGQGGALLNIDGTATPQLTAVAEAFAVLEKGDTGRLQPLRAPLAFAPAPLHVGLLQAPGDDSHVHAIIVNDDTDRETEGVVTFLPGMTYNHLPSTKVKLRPGEGTWIKLDCEPGKEPKVTFSADFSSPQNPVAATDGEVHIGTKGFGVGWDYTLGATKATQPMTPATLDFEVKQLAGEGAGTAYLVYDASFPPGKEAIQVDASTDGKAYNRFSVDAPNTPIAIPKDATKVRMRLAPEAVLRGLWCVRVG